MTERFFSGRECWVFGAARPEELCGHHADLMARALGHDEPVGYLLYSPLREASGAPFGVRDGSGSHALAVTDRRFIVSRDAHQPGRPPIVRGIPFADVLAVDLGEALTLGWLAIRFAVRGDGAAETMFFPSAGIDHVRAALRAWRAAVGLFGPRPCPDRAWEPVWSRTLPWLHSQTAPLLLGDEPRAVLHVAETWHQPVGRRSPVCLAGAGLCAVTDSVVLLAQGERPDRPGALAFAVQVTCLDRRNVRRAEVVAPHAAAGAGTVLALDVQVGAVEQRVTMPIGRQAAVDLERVLLELRRPDIRGRLA